MKLTIKSLLEVVQTGAKNIEIVVLDGYNKITVRLSVYIVVEGEDADEEHGSVDVRFAADRRDRF